MIWGLRNLKDANENGRFFQGEPNQYRYCPLTLTIKVLVSVLRDEYLCENENTRRHLALGCLTQTHIRVTVRRPS